MKNIRISILFLAAMCAAFLLCRCSVDLPVWDAEYILKNQLIEIDDRFHNYTDARCNFLKESAALNPEDLRNIHCSGNDLYLLFPESLLHYNWSTGELLYGYRPTEPVDFVDFTFDKTTNRAYILDNQESQVIELRMTDRTVDRLQLDTLHAYSLIKRLDAGTFMVAIQTIPHPSFATVDFERREVKSYELPKSKKAKDVPLNSDSIWAKYPLYVADETSEGIKVKYLFDDRIYLFNKSGFTESYLVKMGNQKVKFKYPWSVSQFKNNDRFRILKFWHTSQKTYVLSQQIVKNQVGVYDYQTLSQIKDFKNVDGYAGFIAKNTLASLDPYKEEIFMDEGRSRFLSFRKLSEKERMEKGNWPRHMLEATNKKDIVVSVFTMK